MFADISASPVLHPHNKIIEKEALVTYKLFRKDTSLLFFTSLNALYVVDTQTHRDMYRYIDRRSYFS